MCTKDAREIEQQYFLQNRSEGPGLVANISMDRLLERTKFASKGNRDISTTYISKLMQELNTMN